MDCFMFNPKLKPVFLAVLGVIASTSSLYAADKQAAKTEIKLNQVVVNGILPDRLEAVPGSFNVIDQKQLEERRPVSIKEALSTTPGLNIVGEDSMGLNLNIGIRGMNPRRSARTLLMEDGVPIYFAPYGDPSAHYSTPLDRVDRIEVVKGSGQILYGPQTMGGMINFVTKPVPRNGFAGRVTGMVGSDDYRSAYLNAGTGNERGGIMFDALKKKGDGIRDHHKFDIEEYTLKGEIDLTENHTLTAKTSTFREGSNFSEIGLGLTEWNLDKNQAVTGMNDKFNQKRDTFSLKHAWKVNDQAKLSTQAYYQDVERASFRQVHNTYTDFRDEPDGAYGGYGQMRGAGDTCGSETGTITGFDGRESTQNILNGSLRAANCGGRHRPRSMTFYGIEPRLDLQHNMFGIQSDLVVGMRMHWEDIKREQYGVDGNGTSPTDFSLGFARSGASGTQLRERINHQVQAQSYYAQNTFYVKDWSFTPGLRVERYKINKQIYTADAAAIQSDGFWNEGTEGIAGPGLKYSTSQTKVLPGFGVAWNGIKNTTVFAGVHRGFSPARPDRDISVRRISDDANDNEQGYINRNTTKAEVSTNYELGARSSYYKGINVESTLFHTAIDQMIVSTADGIFNNAGKASMTGLELGGRANFGTIYDTPHNVYLTGSWTNLFDAKFKTSGNTGREWDETLGQFNSGDRLPYAPRNMGSLNVGYSHPIGVNFQVGADYMGKQMPNPNQFYPESGHGGVIPSYTLVNASASFKPVGYKSTFFVSGHNLNDKEYLSSRVDGMQLGRGRMIFGGVTYDF
jgi:Fe(3+) dicitrate transport protein